LCLFPIIVVSTARPIIASLPAKPEQRTMPVHNVTWPEAAAVRDTAPATAAPNPTRETGPESTALATDRSNWSAQRLSALGKLRASLAPEIMATLLLPNQGSRIPVFAGTSEVSMTLGAGHLQHSAPLDGSGNIALSAHRDGTFRVLKDIQAGDPVVLVVNGRERLFRVSDLSIVTPERVDVLDPTPTTTLTLITCYPFYFVGSAPKRYVVQAELVDSPQILTAIKTGTTTEIEVSGNRLSPQPFGS